jgi:hypothetical protein
VCEALECLSEWTHHVEVPYGERPRDGDGLERLRREMGLSSVKLASLAMPYNVLGVCHRRGPLESLLESLANKCSRARMMTAGAGVYLP